tara:strand:- start:309 stop:1049 length:741 start_codon:yes stop_codon:yes gene_type:complete
MTKNLKSTSEFFRKNGYCILKNQFSLQEVRDIIININKHIKKNQNNFEGSDINYINGEVNSLHNFKDNIFFDKFSKKNSLIDLTSNLLESKTTVKAVEYFAKPKKVGLASPSHQDNYYWCLKKSKALTMWIALDHASKENGSLFYYSGSHKLGIIPHEPSNAPGSSQTIKKDFYKKLSRRRTFVSLEPGDCLIHHCLSVHGSEKNVSSQSRRGFVIQYKSVEDTIDKNRYNKYRQSLDQQVKQRTV